MTVPRRVSLWLAALLAVTLLAVAAPAVAPARDAVTAAEGQPAGGTGTDTTGTDTNPTDTTPTDITPTDTTGTAEDDADDNDDALVAIAVLLFGAFALGIAVFYLDRWRTSTEALIKTTLAKTGELPELQVVGAAVPAGEEGVRGGLDQPEPVPLLVTGPALLQVGVAATYSATQGGALATVAWTVDPADAGTVDPASGDTARVTATKVGPLKVRGTLDATTAEVPAVAVAPARDAGRVPLVGVGYGGITISIFALTLAAAATVYGKLDGAALVTLAGAVVGYFFVQARGQQANAGSGGGAGGGDVPPPD